MYLKSFVFILILVESIKFTIGDHTVSRSRQMNTLSKSNLIAYGRGRIQYDVRRLNNIYNRVPITVPTRKTSSQRGRIPKLNTRITQLHRGVPISRLKSSGHIPNRKLSNNFNLLNRRRFRGIMKVPKTNTLPIRRRLIPITKWRSTLVNIEKKGLNNVLKQPVKTTRLKVGQMLKMSTPQANVRNVSSNINASSKTHQQSTHIKKNSKLTHNTTNTPTNDVKLNYNTSKSKISKTYAIPEVKSIRSQETNPFNTSTKAPPNVVSQSTKYIHKFIPRLVSYRNKGRIMKKPIPKRLETKKLRFDSGAIVTRAEIRSVTKSVVVNNSDVRPDRSSILTLLNSSRPQTRNKLNENMIRNHLLTLESLRDGNSSKSSVLIRQMHYIKTIAEFNIQREVLKLLVKDIIEKSGVMDNDRKRADVETLVNLITNVNKITAEFANPIKSQVDTLKKTNVTSNTVNISHSDSRKQRKNIGSRIKNALGGFKYMNVHADSVKNTRTDETWKSKLNNFERITRRIPTRQGIRIPGDETSIVQNTNQNVETPVIVPVVSKRVDEPVGGDLGYWTHLSAGLADMLCNLCRKQSLEVCIKRFCTDVRAITTSPTHPHLELENN